VSVAFRYAGPDEYGRVSKFLDEYWAKDHVYTRMRSLFEWTFARSSQWDESAFSFALAEDGEELVGILGGIPFSFNCLGKTSRGVWIVNYAVRPDHRKGSTALQLLSTFRRDPFSVVIASGLNPATIVIYRVLRGLVLPETPRHFVVLPNATARMENLLRLAAPDWTKDRAAELADAFRLSELSCESVRAGSSIPDEWDTVDWPEIASQTVGAVRDRDYLTWRYLQHPSFEYRFLTVGEGLRTGLLVWRLETIRRASEHGREDVDKIGRLVEFLPASRGNAKNLMAAFFQQLSACDALGADFYGYNGAGRAMLEENGFPRVGRHPDGQAIPSRFQPLDGQGGGVLNAMFVQAELPSCTTNSDCQWYWTKSDSDQDRPN
jgi:hypothetical protein